MYSVHRHLHLLFPQLSWGIDTVSFSPIACHNTVRAKQEQPGKIFYIRCFPHNFFPDLAKSNSTSISFEGFSVAKPISSMYPYCSCSKYYLKNFFRQTERYFLHSFSLPSSAVFIKSGSSSKRFVIYPNSSLLTSALSSSGISMTKITATSFI